jgi:hypothetical protein
LYFTTGLDPIKGWGSAFVEPDKWRSTIRSGNKWTFGMAFASPGLLYYWTK